MAATKMVRTLLILVTAFYVQHMRAQCTDCSTVVTDNSVSNYTVTSGQKLCIVGNFTYTGNLTLNGGTICNYGTVKKILFRSGVFENNITGVISATTTANMAFNLNGDLILNNYSGGQMIVDDSFSVTAHTSDNLTINIHKGSSFNCNDLVVNSGRIYITTGLAASTTTNSSFITSFNVNGNATFNYHTTILVKELSSFNINGNLTLHGEGIKTINNYGLVYVANDLETTGDASNNGTITVNNYSEFTASGSINSTITHALVRVNNLQGLTNAIMYVAGAINLNAASTELNNDDVLQVDGGIYVADGAFTNNNYYEGVSLGIDQGVATNNSIILLAGDLQITNSSGVLNNNGNIIAGGNFDNSGTVNLGIRSVIVCLNFNNLSTGSINAPPDGGFESYARIYVNDHSMNAGNFDGHLLFLDLNFEDNKGDAPRIDELFDGYQIGDGVLFVNDCSYDLEPGFIYSRDGDSKRPRSEYCLHESISLTLFPYVTITSGPTWSFAISGMTVSNTGMSTTVYDIHSGGVITAYGTYYNGESSSCPFHIDFVITLISGSITTVSPVRFGVGNTFTLNSTVTVGTPSFQYTWSPNYFFVSPSTNHDEDPVIAPQVSMIYTVNMVDGRGCTASNTVEIIGEPFALLDKELNGEYYNLFNDQLFFKYEGQYDYSNLQYFVYDKARTIKSSTSTNKIVNITTINPGDNRLTLNASSLPSGYYVLELVNEKNEKSYLRFKK